MWKSAKLCEIRNNKKQREQHSDRNKKQQKTYCETRNNRVK